MIKWKQKAGSRAALCIITIVLVVLLCGNYLAWTNLGIITQFFGQSYYKVVNADENEDTQYYKSDYTSMAELQADETLFATQVQAEGSVLLQNKNFPIPKTGKITLLGSDSADSTFFICGNGSGSIDTAKKPSMQQVFEEAGYEVNPIMLDFYENEGKSTYSAGVEYVGEAPQSLYTKTQLDSYKNYSDVGVVFIGRTGQEGNEVCTYTYEDPNKSMLELSQNELDLIDSAIENFDKVVILLNTMNPMELEPLTERNVSVIWIGAGGQQGLRALPGIMNGTYNPSGRLVDTFVNDVFGAPSMQNIGSFEFTNLSDAHEKYYYNYAENIYIGYKYYETRYADKVMNTANVGDFDYAAEVLYPFGYGLSLTTFEYSNFKLTENSKNFTVSVTVTNSGTAAGKEVVQIYMQSPYTQYDIDNGVEKSAIELVGFTKTGEIASGKSETVSVTVPKEYMRAYDAKNAQTYIVDAGDYYFTAGKNAHDALNNVLSAQGYTVADGMTDTGNTSLVGKYTQNTLDSETYSYGEDGEKIVNAFDNASYCYYDSSFTYLTRNNWTGTWPTPLGGDSHTLEASARIAADIAPQTAADDPNAVMPTTGADNGLTLASLIGVDYDSEYWDKLLDQMTAKEMMDLVGISGYGSGFVASISKPATLDRDGPAGISSTTIGGAGAFGYPTEEVFASTWNLELEERLGFFMANDALLCRSSGLYAPAINMHRTPFSGRNFEYFSEDSFQSGIFAATLVKSIQSKGVYCYAKHFAVNDQEINRESAATFLTEQALREIYLRPFEIAVREGDVRGMMVAKNRIGCVWTGANKPLLTDTLRNEWGFSGAVITDSCKAWYAEFDAKMAIDAGLDMYLSTAAGMWDIEGYATNATVMQNLRRACHNQLYNVANSLAMNNIGATSKVVFAMPAWGITLIVVDAAAVLVAVIAVFFLGRGILKARKEDRE